MKKIFYSLISGLAFAVLLSSCNKFNDQFDGLDAKTKPTNVAAYKYELTAADYTAIGTAAIAAGENSTLANSIKTNKYFTSAAPASVFVPYLLKTKYPYCDLGSTAMITSAFNGGVPAYLSDYTGAEAYTLVTADYGASGSSVLGFYPDVTPASYLADVLTAKVTAPTEGKIELVKYVQFTETPTVTTTSNYLLEENFNYGATAGDLTTITTDWTNHSGTTPIGYATTSLSMTGYPTSGIGGSITIGSNSEDANKVFATQTSGTIYLSALVNLSAVGGGTYFLHFMDDGYGYSARVSAKDDGSGKILFGIGAGSAISYGTTPFELNTTYLLVASYDFATGVSNLHVLSAVASTEPGTPEITASGGSALLIQKVGIRQGGGGPTAVIDGIRVAKTWADILVNDVATTIVGAKMNREVYYKYASSNWIPATGIYVLTTEDYNSMGTASGQPGKYDNFDSSMPPENFIPTLLAGMFTYTQNGAKQMVAYKYYSGGTQTRVDEYVFNNGVWAKPSTIINKTEQFVYSTIGWVFDPTVFITMDTPDYQLIVDYVKANIGANYVSSYGNDESYYGTSAYYKEFQIGAGKFDASFATWQDAVKEALSKGFLPSKYPNAVTQVNGVDVKYTITFSGYAGGMVSYVITFQCTKSGPNPEFTFVEGPTQL